MQATQNPQQQTGRVVTPTVLQMDAVECGAASLGIVLGYYGRFVPIEELRLACDVSRDGTKASNIVKAARTYGLVARGRRETLAGLSGMRKPLILFWNFNHFLVLEGFSENRAFLNDPASGPRVVNMEEFSASYTGIMMIFEPGPTFRPGGVRHNTISALRSRLAGNSVALLYAILASLGLVALELVVPAFTRLFVDNYLVAGAQDWLPPILGGLAGVAVLVAIFAWMQQKTLDSLQTKLAVTNSSKFFWHVLHLPISFFTQRFAGEIDSRTSINGRVAALLTGSLATSALGTVLIVLYVLLMLQYDPLLTLLAAAVALLNFVAIRYISRRRTDQNQKLLQERGQMVGTATNGLRSIESLKASGTEGELFARWAGYEARVRNAEQELGFLTQVLSAVPPALLSLNITMVLAIGGLQVINGQLSVGTLVAFQALVVAFMAPLGRFVTLGSQLQEVEGGINRLEDVFQHPLDPRSTHFTDAVVGPDEPARLVGHVELRGVTFGYSKLAPPLIQDLSLTIKAGARVALVGGSGSGKSTIAKLVAGLYAPWSGEILIDGKSLYTIPKARLTNSLSMADQDIVLFEGSIRDNITLWDPTIADSDVLLAARDAAVHDAISARQFGYNSPVEEDGRNFSGGERQRLEIARALASNPTILILDEATSALDAVTEKLVDENMRRRGCTTLIIAHRLSTIRDCDEIVVLEEGKVAQRGTHDQLVRSRGPYARLMQAGAPRKASSLLEDL